MAPSRLPASTQMPRMCYLAQTRSNANPTSWCETLPSIVPTLPRGCVRFLHRTARGGPMRRPCQLGRSLSVTIQHPSLLKQNKTNKHVPLHLWDSTSKASSPRSALYLKTCLCAKSSSSAASTRVSNLRRHSNFARYSTRSFSSCGETDSCLR